MYYTNSYPHALRAEYVKRWEEAHELKPEHGEAGRVRHLPAA